MFTKAQKKQIVRCWKAVDALDPCTEYTVGWELYTQEDLLDTFYCPWILQEYADDPQQLEFLRSL